MNLHLVLESKESQITPNTKISKNKIPMILNNIFIKNFLLLITKPKIDFFSQNPVQFGRRAKRGGKWKIDFFSKVEMRGIEPRTGQCE